MLKPRELELLCKWKGYIVLRSSTLLAKDGEGTRTLHLPATLAVPRMPLNLCSMSGVCCFQTAHISKCRPWALAFQKWAGLRIHLLRWHRGTIIAGRCWQVHNLSDFKHLYHFISENTSFWRLLICPRYEMTFIPIDIFHVHCKSKSLGSGMW